MFRRNFSVAACPRSKNFTDLKIIHADWDFCNRCYKTFTLVTICYICLAYEEIVVTTCYTQCEAAVAKKSPHKSTRTVGAKGALVAPQGRPVLCCLMLQQRGDLASFQSRFNLVPPSRGGDDVQFSWHGVQLREVQGLLACQHTSAGVAMRGTQVLQLHAQCGNAVKVPSHVDALGRRLELVHHVVHFVNESGQLQQRGTRFKLRHPSHNIHFVPLVFA